MKIKSALILITSANSLLGSTLAMHFARLGANVILCDTNHSALVTTAALLRDQSSCSLLHVTRPLSNEYSSVI